MLLRTEFEPVLLSPLGLHHGPENCRIAWDREGSDTLLHDEVTRAEQWLALWPKTRTINKAAGTSYGLKHFASAWHQEHNPAGGDGYIMNGCFLMAARRLGFHLAGVWGRYCWFDGADIWDTLNAYLNISGECVRTRRPEKVPA
jgi:hypothetical protein